MFGKTHSKRSVETNVCVTEALRKPDVPPPGGVSSVNQSIRLYSKAGPGPDSKCNLKSMADGVIDGPLCTLIELKHEAN